MRSHRRDVEWRPAIDLQSCRAPSGLFVNLCLLPRAALRGFAPSLCPYSSPGLLAGCRCEREWDLRSIPTTAAARTQPAARPLAFFPRRQLGSLVFLDFKARIAQPRMVCPESIARPETLGSVVDLGLSCFGPASLSDTVRTRRSTGSYCRIHVMSRNSPRPGFVEFAHDSRELLTRRWLRPISWNSA